MPAPPEDWSPHLGRKVSLRYALPQEGSRHTELLGVLQGIGTTRTGASSIKVMDKRGWVHEVIQADILAAKIF
jgi:hypothetical protein